MEIAANNKYFQWVEDLTSDHGRCLILTVSHYKGNIESRLIILQYLHISQFSKQLFYLLWEFKACTCLCWSQAWDDGRNIFWSKESNLLFKFLFPFFLTFLILKDWGSVFRVVDIRVCLSLLLISWAEAAWWSPPTGRSENLLPYLV